MLSELLSQLPYAFMFHELNMGRNFFTFKPSDAVQLEKQGISLPRFQKRHRKIASAARRLARFGLLQRYMLASFKREIVASLSRTGVQAGVKEIRHEGWEHYLPLFPDMKVIMLGRDPRDIYISFHRMNQRGALGWRKPFNPEMVAALYNEEFARLFRMQVKTESRCIRYEDLCTDPRVLETIKAFCRSPIPDLGQLGSFTTQYQKRKNEYEKHSGQVSSKSIERWRTEEDQALVADAHRFFELVPDFVRFWGYEI